MKFGFIFSAVSALLLVTACNFNNDNRKSFDDVVKYNDFIVDHINALDSAYILALATDNGIDVCMKKCDSLVGLCDQTAMDFKGIQPYEGDSSLTMQALAYTQFMKNNGEKEIKKLLKLIEKYEKASIEEQEAMVDEVQTSAENIDKNYEIEIGKVDKVQKKFSAKHNYTVIK
ncbi:LIC11966 family surface protein [Fluviicola sp.]|uniref:LIC11966 family surface protein n=1 Tax=Fluviicola sp. TaxID=1917219 RepID=UPI003D278930